MTLFDRIVIATDGSKTSNLAVIEGLRVGKACNSSIFVVSVIDTRALSIRVSRNTGGKKYRPDAGGSRTNNSDVKALGGGQNIETFILNGDPVNDYKIFILQGSRPDRCRHPGKTWS